MKPALLEVMRMNRICRMVLATCLGSFILVIFYFQSMLHPGRGRVSVVLLDIFFSLALSLARSLTPGFCPFQPYLFSLRHLGTPCCPACAGRRVGMERRREDVPSLLFFLPAPGWRMGARRSGSFFFFFLFSLFSLCLLSVCLRGSRARWRGCGQLLTWGAGLKRTQLPVDAAI